MPENKKISLNFGRMKQHDLTAIANNTLGDMPVPAAPDDTAPPPQPRGPIALIKVDDDTLEVRETGLTSTFNFETQKVTYVSSGAAVNVAVLTFDQVKSPTAVSDAFANLKMLGGNPKPYTP